MLRWTERAQSPTDLSRGFLITKDREEIKNKGFLDKGVEEDGGGWRGIDGHG